MTIQCRLCAYAADDFESSEFILHESGLVSCGICGSEFIEMLQTDNPKGTKLISKTYIITVEMEDTVSDETITNHLSDCLTWVEGVGEVGVDVVNQEEGSNN